MLKENFNPHPLSGTGCPGIKWCSFSFHKDSLSDFLFSPRYHFPSTRIVAPQMLGYPRLVRRACENRWHPYPRGSDSAGLPQGPGSCLSGGFAGDADVGLEATLEEQGNLGVSMELLRPLLFAGFLMGEWAVSTRS